MDPLQIGITVTSVMMFMIFFGMRVAFASALAGTAGLVWILSTKLGLRPNLVDRIQIKPAVPAKALAKATRIPKNIISIITEVTVIPI